LATDFLAVDQRAVLCAVRFAANWWRYEQLTTSARFYWLFLAGFLTMPSGVSMAAETYAMQAKTCCAFNARR
jgi:hypothetical protein